MLPYKGSFKVTKLYGTNPPPGMTYSAGKHPGVDLVGLTDKTIFAVQGGTVIRDSYDPTGWGYYVVVHQIDGLYAIYSHLMTTYPKLNSFVREGALIGIEGTTGKVTGRHLHFELRKNYADKYSTIEPLSYLGLANKEGVVEKEEKEVPAKTTTIKTVLPDGKSVNYVGLVYNNQNYTPIRKLLEDLGFTVTWKDGKIFIK